MLSLTVILSFFLVISSFFLHSDAVIYYVSADPVANDTCNTSGNITLRPCYSLQQLSNRSGLLFNKSSITLLLLSGTHELPKNHILKLFRVKEVVISPWNHEQEVLINCHSTKKIVFQNITELNIFSLNFTSCPISLTELSQVIIANSIFAKSKRYYAIAITNRDTYINLNVSVVAHFFQIMGHYSLLVLDPPALTIANNFFINDTRFLRNWKNSNHGTLDVYYTNLTLHESSFIDNRAYGGAVEIHYSSVLISSTCFLNNNANNGGAISLLSTHLKMFECQFINNSAKRSGGAIIYLNPDSNQRFNLSVTGTNFLRNIAASGGAIFSAFADLHNCQFDGNYAANLGGAIDYAVISNSEFSFNRAGFDGGAIYCEAADIYIHGGHAKMNCAAVAKWWIFIFVKL